MTLFDIDPLIWLSCFTAMFFLEVGWVFFIRASGRGEALRASFWSCFIHAFGSWGVNHIVDDLRYLTATLLGVGLGTFAVVWYAARKDARCAKQSA